MHDTEEVLPRQQPYVTRGEVVRRLREAKEWSIKKLADEADLGRNTVPAAERNDPSVSDETWEKIAAAFGLEVSDLDVQTHDQSVQERLVRGAYHLLHVALFGEATPGDEGAGLTPEERARIESRKTTPRPRAGEQGG